MTTSQLVKPLLTRNEAAQLLSMSLRSVENFINAKSLTCIRMGKSVRIHPDELQRFIAARTVTASH